jgi:hypothetical protein
MYQTRCGMEVLFGQGLAMRDGKLISCDAGTHPGWPNNDSPTAGWIFQIDFV